MAASAPIPALAQAPLPGLIRDWFDGLDPASLTWLSGYTAGLAAARGAPAGAAKAAVQAQILVVYGSQTGNSRRVAEAFVREAQAAGTSVRLVSIAELGPKELARERVAVFAISTQGDGDPPDDARGFFEALSGPRAPRLEQLHYSVLALGDSSYPQFCQTGRVLDARLAELGARRMLDRADCDLDFDAPAEAWRAAVMPLARSALGPQPQLASVTPLHRAAATTADRDRPFVSAMLGSQRITARASEREVRHLELDLSGSGLHYEPGDAIGIWPRNPADVVEGVLEATGLTASLPVRVGTREATLGEWLSEHREITRSAKGFVSRLAELSRSSGLKALLEAGRERELAELLRTRQPLELLRTHAAEWNAQDLVEALRPLTPRLYSVASSMKAVGDEAHLTVGVIDHLLDGRRVSGAASRHLAELPLGEGRARVFVEANERFRLPSGDRDILMIGAGTGVAPYRGFLQERRETGASGRNWLVFGARHLQSEFLYQSEWLDARKRGLLHRLDVAFSRDQAERIYVQQRLLEHAREVYAYIEGGAHVYLCGDAQRMAPDVHAALRQIAQREAGLDEDTAEAWLQNLIQTRRFAKDVY